MFDKLFAEYASEIDFRSKDTIHGNTVLHMACMQENVEAAEQIFDHERQLCMIPNFLGRSPFFVAC